MSRPKTLGTRLAWSISNLSLSVICCKSDQELHPFIAQSELNITLKLAMLQFSGGMSASNPNLSIFGMGAPVSSYIHYKSPNIVYRANNVLVDAQLSIQYFF
jgi:hypothetical protein